MTKTNIDHPKHSSAKGGSYPCSPRDIHALWQLLKGTEALRAEEFSALGKSLFEFASHTDLLVLVKLGQALGLLKQTSPTTWKRSGDGESFANSSHWRQWTPSETVRKALGAEQCELMFPPALAVERPVVIDLFSGGGGLSIAFESAGFDVKVAVDNDKEACEAHKLNFPECHVIEDDISKIAADPAAFLCDPFAINAESVAGIVGGPPCQGFSFMGERVSGDERNLLTSRFMDVVMAIEPDFFVMENVAGLLTSGSLPDFATHVRRYCKSIGEPATAIVDRLPEAPTSRAKRDRQFRKRTVSSIITEFREKVRISADLDNYAALSRELRDITEALQILLKDRLVQEYGAADDQATMRLIDRALSGTPRDLCLIAIGTLIDALLDSDSLAPESAESLLLQIAKSKTTTRALRDTIEAVVNEYEAAPKASAYKGVIVGPVLSHLLRRATRKYDVTAPTLLNSAWFGAPQSRKRLFVVGIHRRHDKSFRFPSAAYQLPGVSFSMSEELMPTAPTVLEALGDIPDADLFPELLEGEKISSVHLRPAHSLYAKQMRLEIIADADLSLPRPSWNPFVLDCCTRTTHTEDVLERLRSTPEGVQEDTSHKTRLNRNRVSHTLRAGTREGKGSHTAVRPVHFEHHRVITVREGARLMGFPDWMTFHRTKWHGFRLVGNGVPAQLGAAIANAIRAQLYD